MKTIIVLSALAVVGGLMYCKAESSAGTQDLEDKELRALLEAHRDTWKNLVGFTRARLEAQHQIDPTSIVRLVEFERDLLGAELELATSKQDRIAIIEESLKDMLIIEKRLDSRGTESGTGSIAKAARIEIQIKLHKAKKAP